MNDHTPSRRLSTLDHVSGAPPLRLAPDHQDDGAPVDMAAHVTTTPRRVLAIIAFIALCHAQFSIYSEVLLPVLAGDSTFVLDREGPRLEINCVAVGKSYWFSFGYPPGRFDTNASCVGLEVDF